MAHKSLSRTGLTSDALESYALSLCLKHDSQLLEHLKSSWPSSLSKNWALVGNIMPEIDIYMCSWSLLAGTSSASSTSLWVAVHIFFVWSSHTPPKSQSLNLYFIWFLNPCQEGILWDALHHGHLVLGWCHLTITYMALYFVSSVAILCFPMMTAECVCPSQTASLCG